MTPEELLQEYRRWALRRGESEDDRVANAAHTRLLAVVRELRDTGHGRRILELLDDPSEHIRLRAGFDALHLSPDDGVPVLRELAEGPPGEVCASAGTILDLWASGKLILSPWNEPREEMTAGDGDDSEDDRP